MCECVLSQCLGCAQHEKDEVRRSKLLEGMPHKAAANVLVVLDHLDKEMERQRRQKEEEEEAAAALERAMKAAKQEEEAEGGPCAHPCMRVCATCVRACAVCVFKEGRGVLNVDVFSIGAWVGLCGTLLC